METIASLIDPSSVLNRSLFFIKNAVNAMEAKTSDKYDVCDPDSKATLLECREADLSGMTKLRRLAGGKYDIGAPFNLIAKIPGTNHQIFRVVRKVPFFSLKDPPIEFYDHANAPFAILTRKFLCIGRKFPVFSPESKPLFELNVKSILNGYRFVIGKKELGTLWLSWKGDHADYFNEEFNYALSISDDVPDGSLSRQLLLAFALCFHRVKI